MKNVGIKDKRFELHKDVEMIVMEWVELEKYV